MVALFDSDHGSMRAGLSVYERTPDLAFTHLSTVNSPLSQRYTIH